MKVAIITGSSEHSFGSYLAKRLARLSNIWIICLDIAPCVFREKNIITIETDLNPLNYKSYPQWSKGLEKRLLRALGFLGDYQIEYLILCAAVYAQGGYANMTLKQRKGVIGLNLLGQFELINIILRINQRSNRNKRKLTILDIGSSHTLNVSKSRAIYISTKDAGLSFLKALKRGNEVLRSVYLIPSAIDTSMLHDNLWTLKANGSRRFYLNISSKAPQLYEDVFIECSKKSFYEACRITRQSAKRFLPIFREYVRIRRNYKNRKDGVIRPVELAEKVTDILLKVKYSGVYRINAPKDVLKVKYSRFKK